MLFEPAPQHRTVGSIPLVPIEDELRKGVSSMNRPDMLPVKENGIDRFDHDASLFC